jgi:hypothetical protein
MTLAFANAGDEIFDTISKGNVLFYEIKKNGMYKSVNKMKPQIIIPLMYGLGRAEWYEGWDVLGTQPTEGVTDALFEYRQLACPVGYNRREQRMTDASDIKSLVEVKINQTKLTMVDVFDMALLQGNLNSPGGSITDPMSSVTTLRKGIEPLPKLVYYQAGTTSIAQVTDSLSVGGLDQATYPWWRNWSYEPGFTTLTTMLAAFDLMYARCSRGPGGAPDIIITDDTTRSLLNSAYYLAYRRNMDTDNDYPFDNLKFHGAKVVCDEYVPDVYSGLVNTDTYGTAYFLNTKFLGITYDPETNFILTDMQKPVNQDGKIGHSLWMGNATVSNRRKNGVIGKIARTLTFS